MIRIGEAQQSSKPKLRLDPRLTRGKHTAVKCTKFVCVCGPSRSSFALSLFLIVVLPILVIIFAEIYRAPVILAFYLFNTTLSISFLFQAALTDPGIIPRSLTDQVEPPPPEVLRPREGGGGVSHVKFCPTCKIYRDSRAKHCRYCDNCVEKFDHHCPWIGTCVGSRNYRHFVGFILFTIALSMFSVVVCGVNIARRFQTTNFFVYEAFLNSVGSIVLIVVTFIVFLSLLPLVIYHIQLITSNETTNENIRRAWIAEKNPYDQGCRRNFYEVFCTQVVPSKFVQVAEDAQLYRKRASNAAVIDDGAGIAIKNPGQGQEPSQRQQPPQQQHDPKDDDSVGDDVVRSFDIREVEKRRMKGMG